MRTVANLITEELYVLNAEELLRVRGGEDPPAKKEKREPDWDYAIKDLDDDEELFDPEAN